ncbi:MAG: cellulose biosynthesis cyclic di-GMP-binding regulatory protein BcsB, partial [Chloroflexi bacterium]|nr:cellulose biosynthesis cyclic di-GMP-binding regulatory protein BcsB [Chloroflexota bacterium]
AQPTDLRAAMNIAGTVGRRLGGRSVIMRMLRASDAKGVLSTPIGSHAIVIVIGRPSVNSLWDALPAGSTKLQIPLLDRDSGKFQGFDGQPVREIDGVVQDILSPWNPDFRTVLISGATDEAVTRAAFSLASDTSRRALQGNAGIITERPVDPNQSAITNAREILTEFTLADLGFLDRTVNGWGVHELTASFDSSGVPARGARADIVFDHSNVLNSEMSAVSVSLNNIPLADIGLTVGQTGRKTLSVPFPARVLKTGRNVLTVRFQFTAPNSGTPIKTDKETGEAVYFCGSPPADLAWAVLYADSTIVLPPGATGSAGLGSFPFPFIREGRNTNTLLVLPDDLREAVLAPELAATLGRTFTADMVDLPVVLAGKLTDEIRQNSHLIVFGLPWANPVVTEVGPSLPLAIDERGRVVQQPDGPLAAVKDIASMGILETIPSPYNQRRNVLVVTGTALDSLPLALKALDQGGIFGNLAVAQAPDASSKTVRTRLFDIAVVAPPPPPLVQVREAIPGALTAAAALGAIALLTATGLARVRSTRRRTQTTEVEVGEDWLDVLEADEFVQSNGSAGQGAAR